MTFHVIDPPGLSMLLQVTGYSLELNSISMYILCLHCLCILAGIMWQ